MSSVRHVRGLWTPLFAGVAIRQSRQAPLFPNKMPCVGIGSQASSPTTVIHTRCRQTARWSAIGICVAHTKTVMLLIGKTYVVYCDLPIRCVGREDEEVEVLNMGRSLRIVWPLYMDFVPNEPFLLFAGPLLGAMPNGGGGTGISIRPPRAGGGSFGWEHSFCCCSTAADGSPVFCCDGICGCGGCYTGDITYRIGGYGLSFGGWHCACVSDPDDSDGGGGDLPPGPLAGPCVSARFSKSAVIFEDAYTNMPEEVVGKQSTGTVEAEFYVYGGTNGGMYAFSIVNSNKLKRVGGSYLPRRGHVAVGESFRIKVEYEAEKARICPHDGYFNDSDPDKTGVLSHSESAGAGKWIQVHGDEWAADGVGRKTTYPQPWLSGWKEWQIPIGWGDISHTLKGRITPNPTSQRFTIENNGTSTIRKYNHIIERRINNEVYLDGSLQN